MVESADLQQRNYVTHLRRLYSSWFRTILIERLMRSRPVVIQEVLFQDSPEVGFVDHDDMVEAISAYGPYEPLDVTVLPWGTWGSLHVFNAH